MKLGITYDIEVTISHIEKSWFRETVFYKMEGESVIIRRADYELREAIREYND
jgi:hypothetical protein